MSRRSRFDLSKWYMDCVSADGQASIAYCADLRWRAISIAYEHALEVQGDGEPRSAHSLRRHAEPVASGSGVAWCSRALGIDASWRAGARSLQATIYSSEAGSIEWQCVLPAGEASVTTPRGQLRGHGYVEHLRMTVPPWHLQAGVLRWGRIAAGDEAIVWIDWPGVLGTPVVFENGCRAVARHLDDDAMTLDSGTTIAFDRSRVLQRGALGTTALAMIPGLRAWAPARTLAAEECKWLSRAVLRRPGQPDKTRWAIHEVVRWP